MPQITVPIAASPWSDGSYSCNNADQKYRNRELDHWLVESRVGFRIEWVERPPSFKGFAVLPRRGVVE